MIARISKGKDVAGMVYYNHNKTKKDKKKGSDDTEKEEKINSKNAVLVGVSNIKLEKNDPHKTILKTLELYNSLNKKVKQPNRHISLSFHKLDVLSDQNMMVLAKEYMKDMGYENQPFAVYRHFDREHPHIHILTTRITSEGNTISDSYERNNSFRSTERIEQKYDLIVARDVEPSINIHLEKAINNYYQGKHDLSSILNTAIDTTLSQRKPTNWKEFEQELLNYNIVRQQANHKDGHCFFLATPEEIHKFKESKDNTIYLESKYLNGGELNNDYNINHVESILVGNLKTKKENLKNVMGKFYHVLQNSKHTRLEDFAIALQRKGLSLEVFRKSSGEDIGQIYGAKITDLTTKINYKLSELKSSWNTIKDDLIDDNKNFIKIYTAKELNINQAKEPIILSRENWFTQQVASPTVEFDTSNYISTPDFEEIFINPDLSEKKKKKTKRKKRR